MRNRASKSVQSSNPSPDPSGAAVAQIIVASIVTAASGPLESEIAIRLPRPSPIDASVVPARSICSCSAAYDRLSWFGATIAGADPRRAFCAPSTSGIVRGSGGVSIRQDSI